MLRVVAICITAAAALVLAVVVVGPRFFPYRALIVRSGSMSPSIPTGSVAFYRQEEAAQVRAGQVILFSEPDDPSVWVTHRVVRVDADASGRFFVTKGDANASPDPWRVPAEGTGWVVVFHVPYLGYLLSELSNQWARAALIAVPAFSLAFLLVLEVLKPKRAPPRTRAT
ncbi:MAG: signal peptidase I [Acidimicrobiales bacterium]